MQKDNILLRPHPDFDFKTRNSSSVVEGFQTVTIWRWFKNANFGKMLYARLIRYEQREQASRVVSNLQQQRAITEQLRREAAMKRTPISQAVKDIIKYIQEHEQDDCLLVGFSSQRVNPFREKTPCSVL